MSHDKSPPDINNEELLTQFLSYKSHIDDDGFSKQVYQKFTQQQRQKRWILGGALGLSFTTTIILQPGLWTDYTICSVLLILQSML